MKQEHGKTDSRHNFVSETERMFDVARGAKTERRIAMLPFEKLWAQRDAPSNKKYILESNDYERALLKYVAMVRGISVRDLVRGYAREAALREALTGKAFR